MRYRRLRVEGAAYFFTVVTHDRRALFHDDELVGLLQAAITHVQSRHPFEVEAQVILPDHLHAIWQMPSGDANYAKRWRLIKEAFTRSCMKVRSVPARSSIAKARGEQLVWQRRFWEHLIRDEADFAEHLDYIHLNPVRHGLAATPGDWPLSSFRSWIDRGYYDERW